MTDDLIDLSSYRAPDWMHDSQCSEFDGDSFFPPVETAHYTRAARSICSTCPVRLQCLEWALVHFEWGIWGGTTTEERKRIRARRKGAAA